MHVRVHALLVCRMLMVRGCPGKHHDFELLVSCMQITDCTLGYVPAAHYHNTRSRLIQAVVASRYLVSQAADVFMVERTTRVGGLDVLHGFQICRQSGSVSAQYQSTKQWVAVSDDVLCCWSLIMRCYHLLAATYWANPCRSFRET